MNAKCFGFGMMVRHLSHYSRKTIDFAETALGLGSNAVLLLFALLEVHLAPSSFPVGFPGAEVLAFVALFFAFGDAEGDFDLPVFPIQG